MNYVIAIQSDEVRHKNGEVQSFSRRWAELATERGIGVRAVDVFHPDLYRQLSGCHGFLWRFGYDPLSLHFAKRLLPAIEQGLKIPIFPAWATAWHFEDKVAQHYLLEAAGIPAPRTWVFWRRDDALEFCRTATYPLVMKLAMGVQSDNVRLLRNAYEAAHWIGRLFGPGVVSLDGQAPRLREALQGQKQVVRTLLGRPKPPLPRGIQHGYFYLQEFLTGNEFDTRVTVIGDRAFAFRRFNRPGDFRASGSGRINWDPRFIDPVAVRLAYRVALSLGTQSVAIDALRHGGKPVVSEISYTYATWAVRDCPGHWNLRGDPDTGELAWTEGTMRPEDAIFHDFMLEVEAS